MSTIVPNDFNEIRRLVSSGKISLTELMDKLAPAVEPPAETEVAKPKQIVLSPEDKKVLRSLPKQLADLELPSTARKLTEPERDTLVPLFDRVKIAVAAVKKAEEAIKEAMHGHIDSITEGPLGKNGHKLTEGEIVAQDYAKKVVRGTVGGNAVQLTDSDLQDMESEGLITHAQYLAMTKKVPAVRVVAPDAVMAEINKDPSLLDAIAARATRDDQTTAIRMAKN